AQPVRHSQSNAVSAGAAVLRPWAFLESGVRRDARADPDPAVHDERHPPDAPCVPAHGRHPSADADPVAVPCAAAGNSAGDRSRRETRFRTDAARRADRRDVRLAARLGVHGCQCDGPRRHPDDHGRGAVAHADCRHLQQLDADARQETAAP
nr:hypothetical protein [Tanacetum cinerariifolium]